MKVKLLNLMAGDTIVQKRTRKQYYIATEYVLGCN